MSILKKVLITGSKGQLGRALAKVLRDDYQLFLYDVEEMDITSEKHSLSIVSQIQPDCIIHCAAFTRVDDCEKMQEEAYLVNAAGAANVAKAAEYCGAELIHVSTDYIFDGAGAFESGRIRPYRETDQPNPINSYGRTKLEGEILVQNTCKRTYIVRTAWLYGEGHNFVRTMLQLAGTGNPIRVVDDQKGNPTSALELARAIRKLMFSGQYGTYHATCEGECTWYAFAKRIFELAGLEVHTTPITTAEYPTPAKRPKYSVLENAALRDRLGYEMAHWDKALAEYIHEEVKINP